MANEAISKMFGYESPEQFMQSNVSDLYVNPTELESLSKGLLAQDIVNAAMLRVKKKDGSPFWASMTARAVWDDHGGIKYFEGIIEDITERKILENQLRQAQKMEAIGNLAGGVAHDFNNMLSIILGNTEMIIEDLDKANPVVANMQEIQKAAKRSTDLTRQLLAFARKQTIAPKVLDINETIEGILKMLRRLIGENIELAWLPKADLWPVKVDPTQVDQVLTNLCINARDSIEGFGKVTIETDTTNFDEEYCRDHIGLMPGDYVRISVNDTGLGMDKETINNIFEPFFTTKGFGEGTGLGLSTVYGIVKQNKGFINVYSELGEGTTFKIYLPRYLEKVSQPRVQRPAESALIGDETILLVEDEKAILRMTKRMLESLGYSVLTASSPTEAIRIVESHTGEIDLLMTDVVMPEMNGPELAKSMLHLYPNLRCLFMSGYTANMIAHHGVLDKDVHFLNKPFARQDLATKVRETFDDVKSASYL
jgi:PAS domain S-box-containing protein